MSRYARLAGHAALWAFVGSAAVFGAMPAIRALGFSHGSHPLAWLGSNRTPNAIFFNLSAFVLAGTLAAVALWPLRNALPTGARWSARIGAQLVMLSALAFAAQGLLPIDLDDIDGAASGLHGLAWMAWLLMFAAGNALLAWGLRGVRDAIGREKAFLVAQIVPVCVLLAGAAMPAAIAQRLAFVLWFVWVVWVSGRYGRCN